MPASALAKIPKSKIDPKVDPSPLSTQDKIRARAYELYVDRGSQPGLELDDWLQAEQEIVEIQKPLQ